MKKEKLEFASNEFLKEVYESSKFFGEGIYVYYHKTDIKSYEIHPCGWDFISFENIDNDEKDYCVYNYMFGLEDITNGLYSCHPLEGLTLKEILEKIGEENWSFEKQY